MELDDRKKTILSAIVRDYIQTAEPVGSRTIAKKYDVGFSSATIRNEMSDLEEMGYINQPHTSAGRIPSDMGYRFYVDKLMKTQIPTGEEVETIKGLIYLSTISEIDKLIKRTAKAISDITNYTAAIITPSVNTSVVVSLKLIPVNKNEIVAVVVTDLGQIKNVMIRLPKSIEPSMLLEINNMLNGKLCGLTVQDINLTVISSIQRELKGYTEILNSIIPLLYDSLKSDEQRIYMSGAANILSHPEYNDIEKAKNFLNLVENKEILHGVFSKSDTPIEVSIGSENIIGNVEEVKNCSIVRSTYNINKKPAGSIGVIGPTRMNYSRVMGILKCFTEILDEVLNKASEE